MKEKIIIKKRSRKIYDKNDDSITWTCGKHGILKKLGLYFQKNKDYTRPMCKICRNAHTKKYYEKNKEAILLKNKKYARIIPSQERREKEAKFREKHREKRRAYIRKYSELNKDRINELQRERYRKKMNK